MNLRDNISDRRRIAGLTQEDVASRLGVSRQTVGKWESGKAVPELEKLIALCDLLGCTLDELVGRADAGSKISCSGDLPDAAAVEGEAFPGGVLPAASNDGADGLQGKLPAVRAGILATGACALFAAAGSVFSLFGPWPVLNVEARWVASLASLMGVCLGVALIVLSRRADLGDIGARMVEVTASRRLRAVVLALSAAVIVLSLVLFLLAPSTRTTAFACTGLIAFASWPMTFVAAISKNAGR